MFKKLNIKYLFIIFIALFAIVLITKWIQSASGDRNFKDELIKVDTSKISAIVLTPAKGIEIRIIRAGNQWSFTSKGKTFTADRQIMQSILMAFTELKADHIAGAGPEDYSRTGCSDSLVTRVKVEVNEKVKAEFWVGGFAFQYPQSFVLFVRMPDEAEVYAVKDIAPDVFKKTPDDLRNRVLTSIYKQDISKITFAYPGDSSFTLVRDKFKWKLNDVWTDSSKTENYMNLLSHINGSSFAYDVTASGPECSITIEGKNFGKIVLKAQATADTACRWIVSSSANGPAKFNGSAGNLVSQIFVGPTYFKVSKTIERRKK
jgi:hypothetical protein